MQRSDAPNKFTIPFANNATSGYIRAVPLAPTGVAGQASLQQGFPSDNFNPVAAGGTPPFGQDFNGIFNQSTAWSRILSGGFVPSFDSAFSTAVGGYPQGVIVRSVTNPLTLWYCTVDNNTSDPDASGAGWITLSNLLFQQQKFYGLTALPATTFNVASSSGASTTVTAFGSVTNGLNNSTLTAGILTIGTGDDGWYQLSGWLGTNLPSPGAGGTASSYGWVESVGVSTDGGVTYVSINGGAFISTTASVKGPFSGASTPWRLNVGDKALIGIGQNSGVTLNAPCGFSAVFLGK